MRPSKYARSLKKKKAKKTHITKQEYNGTKASRISKSLDAEFAVKNEGGKSNGK